METMLNPFKLFGRLLIALFRIIGYSLTLLVQTWGHISHRRKEKIADSFGWFGRSVTDALADIFK